MPGRDQTGPMGSGAMTGRGLGICNGAKAVYETRLGRGAGRGLGRGFFCRRGVGLRRGINGPISKLTQQELLLEQKELLQREIASIDQALENSK